MFRSSLASCLSEKHVYRGCQSTDDEPEASEGEASRTGHSRLNLNSHKLQTVTQYLLKRKLIIQGKHQIRRLYSQKN